MLGIMGTSTKSGVSDDVEVVRRIFAHIDAGTTDEGEAWREPVEKYHDANLFTEELQLLRRLPSGFIPSAAIPNPGDRAERISFGVPLFAVRGGDNRARVFRNACRHRAMALVQGAGCARAIVCPYHGWTYRLDGELAHVPHAEGFPGLDMSTRGLVEVASLEVDGLIVIDPLDDPGAASSLNGQDSALSALTDGSPWRNKLMPHERLVSVESVLQPMNWKVMVEQFLEGYHIRSAHHDTFYPVQYDNLNVVEKFGPNSRLTFPYRSIERLRDRPESTWTLDGKLTYVYHLFPNTMVATLPGRVSVVTLDPVDIDHTTVTTYSMTNLEGGEPDPPDTSEGPTLLNRGMIEDNEMSAGVQRGLTAGANAFVEFGRQESAAGHFHAVLDEGLARLRHATTA